MGCKVFIRYDKSWQLDLIHSFRPNRTRITKILAANAKVMTLAITTGQASISKP